MEETNINMLVASLITSFNKFQDLMIDNIRKIKDDINVLNIAYALESNMKFKNQLAKEVE